MIRGQLIDITKDNNLVNTSESYAGALVLFGNKLLLPMINIDLMRCGIVGNDTSGTVEFAYLILTDLRVSRHFCIDCSG